VIDDLSFRPLTLADLPMLRGWLEQPHCREWWGDPEVETGYVRDMIEGRDSTRPFIFEIGGAPVGYIQCWAIRDARVEPWLSMAPWVRDLPDDAVGVDLSIGDAALLSRGIGSRVLRAFVAKLRAEGHGTIIIDPDPANTRAVHAYEKAGFRVMPEFLGQTGDSLLMRWVDGD
jgi:RimJ/RimL family protein N-acetyltransferase